jgi:hypothetical protein
MLKKQIIFVFSPKFCQNYAGVTYPVVMSYFLNLEEALIGCCTGIIHAQQPISASEEEANKAMHSEIEESKQSYVL